MSTSAQDSCDWLYDEPEQVPSASMVRAVMVGDDHVEHHDIGDLEEIDDEAYCHECGQLGCVADGRSS